MNQEQNPEENTADITQQYEAGGLPIGREGQSLDDRILSATNRIQILLSIDAGKDFLTWIEENGRENSKKVREIIKESPELVNLIESDATRALMIFKQRLREN